MNDEKNEVVLSLRQVVAGYAVYWHKLAVDSTIFIVTGSIALAGFGLTKENATLGMLVTLSFLVALLSWSGAYLVYLIRAKTRDQQRILLKLDNINQLFEPGVYGEGESLYPIEWKNTASDKSSDPVFRFCLGLLTVLPLPLTLAIFATRFH